jgi:hypothetical protein
MDPLTTLITALVAGATSELQKTAKQVVKKSYQNIKDLIKKKYNIKIEILESDPSSEDLHTYMKKNIKKTGADKDKELIQNAEDLLDIIKENDPQTFDAVGIRFGYVSGRKMEINKISAKGKRAIGVDVERATITEDIVIKDVEVDARKDKGDAEKDPQNRD